MLFALFISGTSKQLDGSDAKRRPKWCIVIYVVGFDCHMYKFTDYQILFYFLIKKYNSSKHCHSCFINMYDSDSKPETLQNYTI